MSEQTVAPLAQPDPDTVSIMCQRSPEPSVSVAEKHPKQHSWLRRKLAELYSAEFRHLKTEFERISGHASSQVEMSKKLQETIRSTEDADEKTALSVELNEQNKTCLTANQKVIEMNSRMATLKTHFEYRLSRIAEKESKKDAILETLPNESTRAIFQACFDRLCKLLFVPSVDRLSQPMSQNLLFGNPVSDIYKKGEVYEPHLGSLLVHCHDFDRFMSYSQKRVAKYLCEGENYEPAAHHFILGCLFRALDGLNRQSGCSIGSKFKVAGELVGYDGLSDYVIKVDGLERVFIVKIDLGEDLESGQPRLMALMESLKLSSISSKQCVDGKYSFGIVTSGQYWEFIKLDHETGEFEISETLGPMDINYCEPGLENENVLPLCRNILGMLEETLKSN